MVKRGVLLLLVCAVLWCVVVVCVAAANTHTHTHTSASHRAALRLIEFDANDSTLVSDAKAGRQHVTNLRTRWVTEQQILQNFVAKQRSFMDITDASAEPAANAWNAVADEYPAPRHQAEVEPLLPELKVDSLAKTITELSALYNRYYTTQTGVEGAQILQKLYTEYANGKPIDIIPFQHSWPQFSLIVRINGSDPNEDARVILGGHLDSVSSGANGKAPGADDDASGSSGVLEVFRVLVAADFKPRRTVEFHAYAAEEVGLRGSQAVAEAYQKQGIKVAGMLQLDMTGYTKPGAVPNAGLVQDYTNANLTSFVGQLIDTYTNIGWVPTTCGYGCSDHASWTKSGYPSAFPFETRFGEHSPFIHTPSDTLANLNLEHSIEFAKLGLSFVVELGLN